MKKTKASSSSARARETLCESVSAGSAFATATVADVFSAFQVGAGGFSAAQQIDPSLI